MGWFSRKAKGPSPEELKAQQLQEQKRLHDYFLAACFDACHRNTVYDVRSDGTKAVGMVGRPIAQSANRGESVVVEAENKTGNRIPYAICQIDIRASEGRFHVHWGAYGRDEYHSISSAQRVRDDVVKAIESWSPFR